MKKLFNKIFERIAVSPIGMLLMLPMLYDAPSKEDTKEPTEVTE